MANPDKEAKAHTIFAATEQFPRIGSLYSDTCNFFVGGKHKFEDKVRLVYVNSHFNANITGGHCGDDSRS